MKQKLSTNELCLLDFMAGGTGLYPKSAENVRDCKTLVARGLAVMLHTGAYKLTEKGQKTFNG